MRVETDRLILRELVDSDAAGMFELDSDPEVHQFLFDDVLTDIQQSLDVIQFVKKQYADNGIGRWAIEEKETGAFVGWCGLKLITHPINNKTGFLDIGYRIIRKYWGKGIATECTLASLDYGFSTLNALEICGYTHIDHVVSAHVLQKCGLKWVETFMEDDLPYNFYRITKQEWEELHSIQHL